MLYTTLSHWNLVHLVALLCAVPRCQSAAVTTFPINLAAAAQLLEITLPLSRAGVRAAYRRKAATTHPDISAHSDAAAQFLRITTAYETLLQFSAFATISPPNPPSTQPTSTAHTHTSTTPNDSYAHHSGEDGELFAKRVAAWRAYWMTSLQAEHLATEAQRVAAQQATLSRELRELQEELNELLRKHQPLPGAPRTVQAAHLIDRCRARYAQCASKHAEAGSAVQTLHARVRMMQEEAARLQHAAQQYSRYDSAEAGGRQA